MHKSVWRVMGVMITTPGKVQKILLDRADVMGLLEHVQRLEEELDQARAEEEDRK